LTELGANVTSIKQMVSSRRTLPDEDPKPKNLPPFFVTLPRTEKSQEIFKLAGLCHISIKVEAYRNQNGLTVPQLPAVQARLG
jgi:hypothetical protein